MSSAAAQDADGRDLGAGAAGAFNPWLIAVVVSIATFMEVLDTTIANVALPYIAGGLGVSVDEASWVVTTYLVANAITLTASTFLAQMFGRKRFYLLCVVLFNHGIMSTNATPQMIAKATMKVDPNQSSSKPRSSTTSSAPRKVATSRKPMKSNRSPARRSVSRLAAAAFGSYRTRAMSAIDRRPAGPLIRKHQCHE